MNILVILLLFILPLLVLPFGSSYFEIPKVLAAEVIIELLLIWTLIKHKKAFSETIKRSTGAKLVIFLILLSLVLLVLYPTNTTFFGNVFRLQGTFLLWHLLLFSLIVSIYQVIKFPVVIPILSLLSLWAGGVFFGQTELGRAYGSLGEPNSYASVTIFLWPFIFFQAKKYFNFLSFIPVISIILMANSRSALLAFFIQIVFLTSYKLFKLPLKLSFLISVIFFLALLTLPFLEGGGRFENRAEIWQNAALSKVAFRSINGMEFSPQSILLGDGFGNIEHTIKNASSILNDRVRYSYVDSAHNIFLDWWIQAGLIGLGVLLYLIGATFKNFIKREEVMYLTCFLGVITTLSFNPVSIVILIYFWWIIGLGIKSNNS